MQGNTRLYLPLAPTLENHCVQIMVLLRFSMDVTAIVMPKQVLVHLVFPKCVVASVQLLCQRAPPIPLSIFLFLSVLVRGLKIVCVEALVSNKGYSTLAL